MAEAGSSAPRDWFSVAPCSVSNDPPEEGGGSSASLLLCNVQEYRCTASPSGGGGTAAGELEDISERGAVHVNYDYELYYDPRADLTGTVLPYLEESILEDLAAALGMLDCEMMMMGHQRRRRRRRRRRLLLSTAEPGRLEGVSLAPRDRVDLRYDGCLSRQAGGGELSSVAECAPVEGGLTVYVNMTTDEGKLRQGLSEEEEAQVRDDVLNYLKQSMDNDVYVVPSSIEGVVFIGDRTAVDGPLTKEAEDDGGDNDGLSTLAKALIGVAGALFLLILLLLLLLCCCLRRRRRRTTESSRAAAAAAATEDALMKTVWDGPSTSSSQGDEETATDAATAGTTSAGVSLAGQDSLALLPQSERQEQIIPAISPSRTLPPEDEGEEKPVNAAPGTPPPSPKKRSSVGPSTPDTDHHEPARMPDRSGTLHMAVGPYRSPSPTGSTQLSLPSLGGITSIPSEDDGINTMPGNSTATSMPENDSFPPQVDSYAVPAASDVNDTDDSVVDLDSETSSEEDGAADLSGYDSVSHHDNATSYYYSDSEDTARNALQMT